MDPGSGKQMFLWLAAVALLLPPVFFLPPVPIDETRYLAVAWNMHIDHRWLVPWLDGAPYSDKPPILFWLINAVWAVTGVHAWAARALELLITLATLPLLASIGRALGMRPQGVRMALWLWLGCAAVGAFAGAIMFDMPLTLATLATWRATITLANRRWLGALGVALALGVGILIKGPVALLVGGMPALLAPWWLPAARSRPWTFYAWLLGALGLALVLALAWAIPAAKLGGARYADEILLRQTAGRVMSSFAHDRPWWWYLPLLPVMTLPWVLAIGRGPATTPAEARGPFDRFALAAFVPAVVVFSLISGKQPHYLLPLLPALALVAGTRLGSGQWRVVGWRVGLLLIAVGTAVAIGLGRAVTPPSAAAYWCGVLIVLLGTLVLARAQTLPASAAALGMLAALGLAKLAFVVSVGPDYDVRAVSRRIGEAQRRGVALMDMAKPQGLFTFAGRLAAPIPDARDSEQIAVWSRAHPDGWLIGHDSPRGYAAAPLYWQHYRGRSLAIWRAADVRAEAAQMARTAAAAHR